MKTLWSRLGIVVVTVATVRAPLAVHAQAATLNPLSRVDSPEKAVDKATTTQPDTYLIGVDDQLKVLILDVPEMSGGFRVNGNGTVTIPILSHPIAAEGLTLAQFSDRLANELRTSGLVSDPHVSTSVDQSRLHSVAITGAVKHPQVYMLFSRTTVLDMLSQSEGLTDDASGIAVVSRGDMGIHSESANNGEQGAATGVGSPITIDLKRLIETGDPKLNIDIYPGDRITVPRAGIIYVVGAVNKPGGFTMKPTASGMTALQALALAEDTKGTAKRNDTVIIRNDPQAPNGRQEIPVALKKVLAGKSPDPVLQPDDILFVPDSAGKRALHRGLEAAIATTTGVAIYRGR